MATTAGESVGLFSQQEAMNVLASPHPISAIHGGTFYANQPEEMDLDIFNNHDLLQLETELEKSNQLMAMEVALFERYLHRVQPPSAPIGLQKNEGGVDSGTTGAEGAPANNGGAGEEATTAQQQAAKPREKKKKSEKSKETDRIMALSIHQKIEITQKECDERKDEIERLKEEWERDADNLRAEMEEIEMRMGDIKKDMYDFKRDIEQQAINPLTGKIIAERVLRYYEEKVREKDTIIEKVRLKNSTLKTQRNKLQINLKQKEEMGEVLHAIDFDQLSIENAQYQAKIEEKNLELLQLKTIAAKTIQVLNADKQKMNALSEISVKLSSEIASRKDTWNKLQNETQYVTKEKEKVNHANQVIQKRLEDFRVPEILDYVNLKIKLQELQVATKSWERKVEIQEMAAKKARQAKVQKQ